MLYKRNYSFQHSLLFLLIFSKSFLIKHKDHFLSLLDAEVWPPPKEDCPLLTGCVQWPIPCGIWMLISDEDFSILISEEVPCAQNWRAWFFPSGWGPATCPLTVPQHRLSSVQFNCSVVSDCLQPHGPQHARPPCPSPTPGVYSNSCPLSRWCHPTISSSVALFSSCLQSFPASGSFQISQFFASGGQSIGVSASAMNIQDLFPLGWTDWISLQYKGLSRVFSDTTVQKHQFFSTQLSF